MKKLNLFVALTAVIFAVAFVACNNNSDIIGDKYTPISVNKDTLTLMANADSSSYIKATSGALIKSVELILNNKDTVIENGTHEIIKSAYCTYQISNDTLLANWCKIVKTKEDPATFRIFVMNNDTGQIRKATLTLNGFLLRPAKITIIQQAN